MVSEHDYKPVEASKGFWGYHQYKCARCGKVVHIGMEPESYEGPCKIQAKPEGECVMTVWYHPELNEMAVYDEFDGWLQRSVTAKGSSSWWSMVSMLRAGWILLGEL